MIIDGKKFASLCDIGTWEARATLADVDRSIEVAKQYNVCSIFTPKTVLSISLLYAEQA